MTSLQISMLMNIGSLILGVSAWILAVLAMVTPKAIISHRNTILSFSFCAISLAFQLFEINNRMSIGDYAAIEDTIRTILIASVALIAITIILNAAALVKIKNK